MKNSLKRLALVLFHTTSGRILVSCVVLATTGLTAVTIGAQANFTTGATGSTAITTATLALTVPADGTTNRLDVAATSVFPGDTIARAVDLTNGGTFDLTAVTLATTGSTSNLLTTDTTNGLQLKVDICSVAWTETSNTPRTGYSYTCSGTTTSILTYGPVINASRDLGTAIRVHGTTLHYVITMQLPSTADNTFQTLSNTITYNFNTTQPSATTR